jgi:hypothetical protein
MRMCLQSAMDELRGKPSKDMAGWQWGKLHSIASGHPPGQVKPLNQLFHRGLFPVSGDSDTVCQMAFAPGKPHAVTSQTCPGRLPDGTGCVQYYKPMGRVYR